MRNLLFLLAFADKAFADIVWSCEQAAEICINDRIFIPEAEICQDQNCLTEKNDLCNQTAVFKDGQYSEFFCEQGTRTTDQVIDTLQLSLFSLYDHDSVRLEAFVGLRIRPRYLHLVRLNK